MFIFNYAARMFSLRAAGVGNCVVCSLNMPVGAALQDGDNVNNIITVLPRDAVDNAIRERLLSQTGVLSALIIQNTKNLSTCLSRHLLRASFSPSVLNVLPLSVSLLGLALLS